MAAAPAPDYVVFNGVANQYQDAPLQVATGEPDADLRARRRPEHRQLVPHRGHDLRHGHQGGRHAWPRATPGTGASQAVDLSPAQGAIVEFTTAEDGLYPMVTHAFNFVGRGALGIVKAGDGDPAN